MISAEQVIEIVENHFKESDFFIVDVQVKPVNVISVFIEKENGLVGINDCVSLSKHIESCIDRETEDFELEVSSAGMDSPFKTFKQYIKHQGKEVAVIKTDGNKLKGILVSTDENGIELSVSEKKKTESSGNKKEIVQQQYNIPFNQIKETKRVFKF